MPFPVSVSDGFGWRPVPGARSIYGYDYDVLGMVLGRAYNMTPEALMREKLWDPIGMDSAMLFHAKVS